MAPKRKLVELTLNKKKEILDLIEKGESQRKLAEKFGVAKTTIGNIVKNKELITKSWIDNCSDDRKRKLRKTPNEEVNVAVLEFFRRCRSKNIPISGPMLQVKAKEIAHEIGLDEFNASNGWLEAFRIRNNINFRVLCGESASADTTAADDWKSKLSEVLLGYPIENQFNADETGLFFRQLPTKSLIEKKENCFGGKLSKQRLTVLFCCSASGEKLKPLVIGNAANPRAFKQNGVKPQNLPVIWRSNKKAWMNTEIFQEWLRSVNSQMKAQRRQIILLIDNVSSHAVSSMSNVEIKFLPPNLTCMLQPLDQGIICAVKQNYRKMMLQCLVTKADECKDSSEFSKSITVYDAIRWLITSWQNVQSSTIRKCFYLSGFPLEEPTPLDIENESENTIENIYLALPQNMQDELSIEKNFASFDNELVIHEDVGDTADEIFGHVLQNAKISEVESEDSVTEEVSDDDSSQHTITSYKEAINSIKELQHYAATLSPELSEELMQLHGKFEEHWVKTKLKNSRQSKINDYFSPDS